MIIIRRWDVGKFSYIRKKKFAWLDMYVLLSNLQQKTFVTATDCYTVCVQCAF